MIESVKYTLESTIDNSERELFQIDDVWSVWKENLMNCQFTDLT